MTENQEQSESREQTEIEALVDEGNVEDVVTYAQEHPEEVDAIREAEKAAKARKGVLDALDAIGGDDDASDDATEADAEPVEGADDLAEADEDPEGFPVALQPGEIVEGLPEGQRGVIFVKGPNEYRSTIRSGTHPTQRRR